MDAAADGAEHQLDEDDVHERPGPSEESPAPAPGPATQEAAAVLLGMGGQDSGGGVPLGTSAHESDAAGGCVVQRP